MHEDVCIGIHVGDGKCVAVYDDGTCDKPIPWDEQCIANICTSMCDDKLRCRIHVFKRRPMAVYVASDGIDDTFGDGGELYNFYRKICFNLSQKGDSYIDDLSCMLPVLSEKGSKDDMSVAGIYNIDKIRKAKNDLLRMIEQENNNSELIRLRQELVGAEYRTNRTKSALEDAIIARDIIVKKREEAEKNKDRISAAIKRNNRLSNKKELRADIGSVKKSISSLEKPKDRECVFDDLQNVCNAISVLDKEIEDADKTVRELDENHAKAQMGLEQIQSRINELEHQNEQGYDTETSSDEPGIADDEDDKRVE